RIGPGLEVDDDQEIDEHDGGGQAEDESVERAVHGLDLSEHDHVSGLRRLARGFVDDLLHVGGNSAKIAVLRGAVNLDHRLDVVVGINGGDAYRCSCWT